jgi:hypothetical protein
MALEVEDGTAKANANAYVSAADADTYFTLRGNENWTDADTADKEAAIVRATFALDAKYGPSWVGVKKTQAQALQWPRIEKKDSTTGVTDADGYEIETTVVPQKVIDACCEVALIELTERFLSESVDRDSMVTSERVGPISTTWSSGAPTVTLYPHIDAMLQGLAGSASGVQFHISLTDEEKNQGTSNDPFDYPEYFNLVKYP